MRTWKQQFERKNILVSIACGALCALVLVMRGIGSHDSVQPYNIEKQLSIKENTPITTALFSRSDNIRLALIELIRNERVHIRAALYMLTDAIIGEELLSAYQRGVHVDIITHHHTEWPLEKKGPLWKLHQAGVPVLVYQFQQAQSSLNRYAPIMHHKFFVFTSNIDQRSIIVTGSFNCTYSAQDKNHENVVILDNHDIVQTYTHHFDEMIQKCHPLYQLRKKDLNHDHRKKSEKITLGIDDIDWTHAESSALISTPIV